MEKGGTHYCAGGCLSDDRTDAYYFTPVVETFQEAAEREEVKALRVQQELAQQATNEFNQRLADEKDKQMAAAIEVLTDEHGKMETPAEFLSEQNDVIDEIFEAEVKNVFADDAKAVPTDLFGVPIEPDRSGALVEKFGVPPFSVLDARQGYWKKRKQEWLAMGIAGEEGRIAPFLNESGEMFDPDTFRKAARNVEPGGGGGPNSAWIRERAGRCFGQDLMKGENPKFGTISGAPMPLDRGYNYAGKENAHLTEEQQRALGVYAATNGAIQERAGGHTGTSVFDPVLCELIYKWFCPAGGHVLDPFAGESTKGIVATKLGYQYTGIELRPEQIAANQRQAAKIGVTPNWLQGDSAQLDKLLPMEMDGCIERRKEYDLIFTSPPYYDLEIYSESEKDGSAFESYTSFIVWYCDIFMQAVRRLKWNRFAVVKIGEIRDENGWYRNFVGDNITCFTDLDLKYYNEIILVTAIGSLPLRVGQQFGQYRKIGKTHQNILVFYKGSNPDQIKEKFGE
jgi:DNA modification methylase